jgi:hypothetical protein
MWTAESRAKTAPDDMETRIDERPNAHNQLVFNKKRSPGVISNRDFLSRMVWKKAEAGGYIVVSLPEDTMKRVPQLFSVVLNKNNKKGSFKNRFKNSSKDKGKGWEDTTAVRGTHKSVTKLEKIDSQWTKVVQVAEPCLGGRVPNSITNRWVVKSLAGVTAIQEYFEQLRGKDEYDYPDGRALGYRRECDRASEASATESERASERSGREQREGSGRAPE